MRYSTLRLAQTLHLHKLSTFFHNSRDTSISSPRSLRYEYELYVEHEIEDYKDSVSRSSLLKLGDEAVATLQQGDQTTLTEMLVWQEVDRIISRRLRLPSYATWRRRRLKILAEYQRPEHWGFDPQAIIVRALADSGDRHVLVAGAEREGPAMYLAAHGAAVTALEPQEATLERVVKAAAAAGLTERVRSYCADLSVWEPDVELHAVVCSPLALAGLHGAELERVLGGLQSATRSGGVHVMETATANLGNSAGLLPVDELRNRYRGWSISVEEGAGSTATFVARKEAAVA